MEIFLMVTALLFFIFGSLLLLSPESFMKISNFTNRILVNIDEKIHSWRRPIAIFFLAMAIFLWYIALSEL